MVFGLDKSISSPFRGNLDSELPRPNHRRGADLPSADGRRSISIFPRGLYFSHPIQHAAGLSLSGRTLWKTQLKNSIRLAPRMAHLIRDELSVTQNAVELLMKDQSISPEVREKIASIKGQVHLAAASATQFLRITKTEHTHQEVVDVREVLSALSPLLQRLLGDNVHLQLESDQDLWPIKINLEQFEHIFCILAVNASDAMPAGGTLQIRAIKLWMG